MQTMAVPTSQGGYAEGIMGRAQHGAGAQLTLAAALTGLNSGPSGAMNGKENSYFFTGFAECTPRAAGGILPPR